MGQNGSKYSNNVKTLSLPISFSSLHCKKAGTRSRGLVTGTGGDVLTFLQTVHLTITSRCLCLCATSIRFLVQASKHSL